MKGLRFYCTWKLTGWTTTVSRMLPENERDSWIRNKGLYYPQSSKQHELDIYVSFPRILNPERVMQSGLGGCSEAMVLTGKNLELRKHQCFTIGCKHI